MGLARAERNLGDTDETADRGLTQSGDVMGTVDYMSPEQAASTKRVDERTDIYSLGCTLFYLLHGRPVYEGATLVDKVLAHREKPIPKLHASRDDVPSKLDLVFRRMVGKKPEQPFRFDEGSHRGAGELPASQGTRSWRQAGSRFRGRDALANSDRACRCGTELLPRPASQRLLP